MKATGIISIAILSLLLGTAAVVYAQQDQDKPTPRDEKAQKDKSAKQEGKNAQQQDKNNTNQREKNAKQQDNNSRQEEKNAQEQNKNNTKQEEKSAQQQDKNNRQEKNNAQQQNRNNKQDEKNTQQAQRAGGNGRGRIPEDRFRASFGREHSFRVNQADYSRDRRFQYGGYSFVFVDEWPSNWLYTQDVFVVEIDGVYYLCNAMYPGVNITLNLAD
jgi:outer membrane biosynthesis protein TonB